MPEGFDGVGRSVGPRTDLAPDFHDLECDQCRATWTGRDLTACNYCAGLFERSLKEQSVLILTPDLPPTGHPGRHRAELAWAKRLVIAVKAEIITETAARAALTKAVNSHAR